MITLEERESEHYDSSQYTDTRRRQPFKRVRPNTRFQSTNEDENSGRKFAKEIMSLSRSKTRNPVEGRKDSNVLSDSPEVTAFEESERRI
jgi:hypothetical protein